MDKFKQEEIYVKGKAKWVKAVVPDQMYNKWSMQLYPDAVSLEKIRELQSEGIKNRLKKDDDGYNISFSRPVSKENRKTGKVMNFQAPIILNKEGQPWDDVRIGNGSDVTVKLEVYEHAVPGSQKKAKAARWAGLRVDTLVPFNKDTDFTEEEAPLAAGFKDQPETLF